MTVINTLNETSLHRTLKNLCALQTDGKTEQKSGRFTCDVIAKNGEVIEIQTSKLSALKAKIQYFLDRNTKITIVHPLMEEKIIQTLSPEGTLLTKRKSPSKQTVYTALRSLTALHVFVGNPGFSIEFFTVSATEIRQKTKKKVQNKTKTRRHLKDYIVKDKILNSIDKTTRLTTKEDWKKLLPPAIKDQFTPPQLHSALMNMDWPKNFTQSDKKTSAKYYSLLIWFLEKAKIIEKTGQKKGKSWIYRIL